MQKPQMLNGMSPDPLCGGGVAHETTSSLTWIMSAWMCLQGVLRKGMHFS